MVLKDNNLNKELFLKINVVGGLIFLVVSAYSFFFSCICNDERKALSYSASLTILFFALDMVGKLSDKLEWMKIYHCLRYFDRKKLLKERIIYGR